jgi:DNA polymerase Ligase (LigD)
MHRFVVLTHDFPLLHWDFMLEKEAGLRTWRLSAPPAPGRSTPAEPLPDHRHAYLDYEGPVSGDRGTVTAWDRGIYRLLAENEAEVVVHLEGQLLHGTASVKRRNPGTDWEFLYHPDPQ